MFGISANSILLGTGTLSGNAQILYLNNVPISSTATSTNVSGYFYPVFTYGNAQYTLVSGDSNNILRFTGAQTNPILIGCPNYLPVGFRVLLIQDGSGMVLPSGSNGAIIQSRDQYSGTLGPYSEATLTVKTNSAGNTAVYNLIGDIT